MKPTLPLTVVVPAFSRADQTRRLIASLELSSHRFEVIVVDDGSPRPLSTECAPGVSLELRFVRRDSSAGPAAARNLGTKLATNNIIAFIDNDCVATPDWALRIHKYMSRLPPSYAGVGGRTLPLGDDVFSRYFGYHKTLDPWIERGKVLYVVTANAAFRRENLLSVGGFDEALSIPGGEDPGVCFKLDKAGFRLAFDADAVVFHDYRRSLREFARTFFRYGAGCRHQADRYAQTLLRYERHAASSFGDHP